MEQTGWQKAVQCALVANVPVLIEGDPGIGKTAFIYALTQTLGLQAEIVIASLREPSDFLGLPIVADSAIKMAPPQWAHRLAVAGERGVLVLDEITTAPPAVQAALLRVVLERAVGDLKLPPEVRVIALANPPDQAGGWDLSLPLANRFFHVRAQAPEAKRWVHMLQDNFTSAPSLLPLRLLAENESRAKSLIGGFLTARPELMLSVPTEASKDRNAWPSPRSWDNASRLLAVGLSADENDLAHEIIAGTVGSGIALEFMAWFRALDLPQPEDVLARPHKFKVPARLDQVFVVLDSVSSYAVAAIKELPSPKDNEMWLAGWEVIGKVVDAGMPDVALLSAKKLAGAQKEGFTLPHKKLAAFRELLRGIV